MGLNDSWAVRWHASALLAGKLTLYPGRSLIHNIGGDSTGTHYGDDTCYDTTLSATPIDLRFLEVESSLPGRLAFEIFFSRIQDSFVRKIGRRFRNIISKAFV